MHETGKSATTPAVPAAGTKSAPANPAAASQLRPSLWTTGPAWLAVFFAAVAAGIGVLNYVQGREEKRLHVEPRVLWDVGAFREGDDWQFAATNTGGVDVEGYDVEFEVASFPLVRTGLDPRVSAQQTHRWGKRIPRGEIATIKLEWSEDARSLRDACARATGKTPDSPCVLGVRVTEIFHRTPDFRRFHRARIFIPVAGVFRVVDEVALTQESVAIQRYFAAEPSKLLGRVPIADGAAHGE